MVENQTVTLRVMGSNPIIHLKLYILKKYFAWLAEMVDAADLKFALLRRYRFDSDIEHKIL